MHANRFMNRFANRFALFTSPHVNRVNGFRIDSNAHDMKSNDLNALESIHESIQVCNRTHSPSEENPHLFTVLYSQSQYTSKIVIELLRRSKEYEPCIPVTGALRPVQETRTNNNPQEPNNTGQPLTQNHWNTMTNGDDERPVASAPAARSHGLLESWTRL